MALTASAEAQQGTKRTVIMILVIGLHLVAFWALQNGLARRLVEVLPNDIKTKIIEEQKKEEPPPPPPPPPDMQTPPPPFVPPPEVTIATPATPPPNAITQMTQEKPAVTQPPVVAPEIVKPRPDPRHPFGNPDDFYPYASKRDGEEGLVMVSFVVDVSGRPSNIQVATSSGFPRLDEAAIKYVKTVRLLPATKNGVPFPYETRLPIRFKLKDR
ncbi:MAG TPA: TonB family protein [Steroidobacteraceae bacterium]|nr:TonB family protein [Steroidobacteraceae bacterium]